MKRTIVQSALIAAFLAGACSGVMAHQAVIKTAQGAPAQAQNAPKPVQAAPFETKIISNSGAEIGTAVFRGTDKLVVFRVEIRAGGLTPGWHGLHFHSVGDCSDMEKFQNSKGHMSHGNTPHGLLNPQGTERGDLPNIWVALDGSAKAEFATQMVTLSGGEFALKDADGSALVIHAAEDDHISQPIGNSGGRVACSEIR